MHGLGWGERTKGCMREGCVKMRGGGWWAHVGACVSWAVCVEIQVSVEIHVAVRECVLTQTDAQLSVLISQMLLIYYQIFPAPPNMAIFPNYCAYKLAALAFFLPPPSPSLVYLHDNVFCL